ncbi:MAG: cytochrome c biogenesis protein CcdA [Gemmatimonadales bacterium]|nr:cytochrome c biogenesis protein CcdA [Gemmatimonadales bacterium]
MFAAGLATSLTPCIYPMIPITAGILGGAGAAGRSKARTLALTLTYVSGLALVYASLGLVAGLSGTLFGAIGSNPWAYFAMGNLLLLAALALLGVFTVQAPQAVLARLGRIGGDSLPATFVLGATSGLVAAPCGAPAFAAALTFVGATQSAVLGFGYLLAFSLGMTAILVAVGLSSGLLATLPRSGTWMVRIKQLGGVVLLGMAEYYFVQMGRVS